MKDRLKPAAAIAGFCLVWVLILFTTSAVVYSMAGDKALLAEQMLRHTSTLGVRVFPCRRYVLSRQLETVETPLGPVRRKVARGFGVERKKWEYEDLAAIARERDLPLDAVRKALDDGCAD